MAKNSSMYRCQVCGYATPKWLGRCPDCGGWNTLAEEAPSSTPRRASSGARAVSLTDDLAPEARRGTGLSELDHVLGGGIVPGSVVLLGGEPGVGKSTLMLQVAQALTGQGRVLIATAEESLRQITLRAQRLGIASPEICLLAEAELSQIESELLEMRPAWAVVDSIQTVFLAALESAPGTVSQVRECAARLIRLAKDSGIPLFLVGHVTKDGAIAGPRLLEHMVDVVLSFEGDRSGNYRMLRAVKNRFGATGEVALFEMASDGLRQVLNPSELMLAERSAGLPGSVVVVTTQGRRPLLTEVQALVSPSHLTMPRRVGNGVESSRLALILAILQRRAGIRLDGDDIYVSVAGGLRLDDPGADLAIALAVASAKQGRALSSDTAVFGELGLSGEVRAVPAYSQRLREACKLGFERVLAPRAPRGAGGDERQLSEVKTLDAALGCMEVAQPVES